MIPIVRLKAAVIIFDLFFFFKLKQKMEPFNVYNKHSEPSQDSSTACGQERSLQMSIQEGQEYLLEKH